MNFLTPNAADPFSRFMAEMYDERDLISVSTGFLSFFGNPANGGKTFFSPDKNIVDIDIIRGNEKIAALIPRGTVSRSLGSLQKNVSDQNYTSFSRKFPLSEEEGDLSAEQLIDRVAGENPYQQATQQSRLRILARDKHTENMRRTIRMFEVLAVQSLMTGKQDAIIGTSDTNLQYNFQRSAGNTITVTIGWNQTSATIMADIDTACDRARTQGKVMPDFMGIGGNAMDAFLADPDVKEKADNRRFELIEISDKNPVPAKFAKQIAGGWVPRGRLRTPKGYELWMFTYVDVYTNSSGNPVKYMPETKAVITSVAMARMDRYFGPRERLPFTPAEIAEYQSLFGLNLAASPMPPKVRAAGDVIRPEMFYTDAYRTADKKKLSIRTQSAPIFATTVTDGVVVLDGLVT